MMENKTSKAYAEVDAILELLEEDYANKVPNKIRNFLKEEKDKEYKPKIDVQKSLLEQHLQRETFVLLTIDKSLNPEGKDYLEEFTNVPNIEHKLKEMIRDSNKEGTYVYEMRHKAIENRKNGTTLAHAKTEGEKRADNAEQKLSMSSLKRDREDSKVTLSEFKQSQEGIKDRVQSKGMPPKQSEYEING